MSTREFFIKSFRSEKPTFVKVLRALPSGQATYRPHPRSTSAGDIAWLLAGELHDACELLDRGEAEFSQSPAPATLDESIAADGFRIRERTPGDDGRRGLGYGQGLLNGGGNGLLTWRHTVLAKVKGERGAGGNARGARV